MLIFISACKTKSLRTSQIIYHQFYSPVQSTEIYDMMNKTFLETQRLYGKPKIPVKEVFIYNSTRRTNLAELAIADVADWKLLIKNLKSHKIINKILFKNLQEFNECERLDIIFQLNSLINSKNLCKNVDINIIKVSSEIKELIEDCQGWFFFESSRSVANRRLLDRVLGNSILRYPQKHIVGENFALCEIVDKANGKFVLYIYGNENTDEFKLLLFHETAHLLNAELRDWYVEGFNNVFAEDMAKKIGVDWTPWRKRFVSAKSAKKEPYAIAYRMMRDIRKTSPQSYDNLLQYANGDTIDISKWLNDIPKSQRDKVYKIILRYSQNLNQVKGSKNKFKVPKYEK